MEAIYEITQEDLGCSASETLQVLDKYFHLERLVEEYRKSPSLTSFEERQDLRSSLAFLRSSARRLRFPNAFKLADNISSLFEGGF